MQVQSFKIANHAFICAIFHNDKINFIRIGNDESLLRSRINADMVLLTDLIRIDMNLECEYITQRNTNFTYLGLPRKTKLLKKQLEFLEEYDPKIKEIQINEMYHNENVARYRMDHAFAYIYYFQDRNVKIISQNEVRFNLKEKIAKWLTPTELLNNFLKLNALYQLYIHYPIIALQANNYTHLSQTIGDVTQELIYMDIKPESVQIVLNSTNKRKSIKLSDDAFFSLAESANNSLIIEMEDELEFNTDYDLTFFHGDEQKFAMTVSVYEKCFQSFDRTMFRLHPITFDADIIAYLKVIERYFLYSLLRSLLKSV